AIAPSSHTNHNGPTWGSPPGSSEATWATRTSRNVLRASAVFTTGMNRGAARPSRGPVSQWEPMHLPGALRVGGHGYGAHVPGVVTFLRVAPAITFASGVARVVPADLLSWRHPRAVRGGSLLARHAPLAGGGHHAGTSR